MNYYNENDRHAAEWLRALIADKLIPEGVVDERSICDVQPTDLAGYTQCHFFAGIGGWAYALQLAGWESDRPVWTGSCPCQPFSVAGKGKGESDVRHLWPEFARLIRECRPPVVFGEQVAAAIGHGWLDGVFSDLENEGYACGAAVLGAHSVGAPHIRQRLYWVAQSESDRRNERRATCAGFIGLSASDNAGEHGGLADGEQQGLEGHAGDVRDGNEPGRDGADTPRSASACGQSHWADSYWHHCRDGKYRRVPAEPGLQSLVDWIYGRVGLLRGAGNAIVPQCAAAFITATYTGDTR
jgi:DNA (cytosine-5)-methyltransferase 1